MMNLAELFHRRSLRTRLTAVLVSLAAVGLILLAAVTYASQKNFLEQRVDEQARAVLPIIGTRILTEAGISNVDTLPSGATMPDAPASTSGTVRDRHDDGRLPPGARDLPTGTFAQVRTSTGSVLGQGYVTDFSEEQSTAIARPKLPTTLPQEEVFTVDAVSGGGRYRVHRSTDPSSGRVTLLAIPVGGLSDQLSRLIVVDGIVILAILALLGLIASRLVRSELAPLRHIAEDADAIAAGELDRRVPQSEPGTEVGRLGIALNAMLARIEQAFAERQASEDRLRRFLSDASHELRTPLASIRGYAELQRTGVISGEEERQHAVSRIEEQAARMGTLVEDLLALARLDEERRPATDLVDVAAIARDAVADAGALDATRTLELTVEGDPFVLGQEPQLRQVLTNLLGNAVAHTPAGSPVAVTVRTAGSRVVVDVDDAGDGVPVEQREQIFERFHRSGGTARTRGPAGAGLGLAVVRGLVEAHGGHVTVGDAPTGGARFTVTLPLAETADVD